MFLFAKPDLTGYALAPLTIEPALDAEGNPRTNKTGDHKFAVQTLVTPPRSVEGYQPAPFVIKVTVAAKEPPTFAPAQPAEFIDLRQFGWEMDGRSGVSFSATAIRQVAARKPDNAA